MAVPIFQSTVCRVTAVDLEFAEAEQLDLPPLRNDRKPTLCIALCPVQLRRIDIAILIRVLTIITVSPSRTAERARARIDAGMGRGRLEKGGCQFTICSRNKEISGRCVGN